MVRIYFSFGLVCTGPTNYVCTVHKWLDQGTTRVAFPDFCICSCHGVGKVQHLQLREITDQVLKVGPPRLLRVSTLLCGAGLTVGVENACLAGVREVLPFLVALQRNVLLIPHMTAAVPDVKRQFIAGECGGELTVRCDRHLELRDLERHFLELGPAGGRPFHTLWPLRILFSPIDRLIHTDSCLLQ